MTTFHDLGLDVPLFAAPVTEAGGFINAATCTLCHVPNIPCFKLGIGDDVIVPCPACQTLNALDADEEEDVACTVCGHAVPFPESDGAVHACLDCIQAGQAAFSHDTVLGMVRWEDAQRGLTHGVPGDPMSGFSTSLNEDGWTQAHVSVPVLLELTRTPNYLTWQGEQWQFCHRQPMVYLGRWTQADFQRAAPDGDGRSLFVQSIDDPEGFLWGSADGNSVQIYVFRCRTCGGLRAHQDCD